jgi:hypothetical protein
MILREAYQLWTSVTYHAASSGTSAAASYTYSVRSSVSKRPASQYDEVGKNTTRRTRRYVTSQRTGWVIRKTRDGRPAGMVL